MACDWEYSYTDGEKCVYNGDGYNFRYGNCCNVTMWRFWFSMIWVSILICVIIAVSWCIRSGNKRREAKINAMVRNLEEGESFPRESYLLERNPVNNIGLY